MPSRLASKLTSTSHQIVCHFCYAIYGNMRTKSNVTTRLRLSLCAQPAAVLRTDVPRAFIVYSLVHETEHAQPHGTQAPPLRLDVRRACAVLYICDLQLRSLYPEDYLIRPTSPSANLATLSTAHEMAHAGRMYFCAYGRHVEEKEANDGGYRQMFSSLQHSQRPPRSSPAQCRVTPRSSEPFFIF